MIFFRAKNVKMKVILNHSHNTINGLKLTHGYNNEVYFCTVISLLQTNKIYSFGPKCILYSMNLLDCNEQIFSIPPRVRYSYNCVDTILSEDRRFRTQLGSVNLDT
jgi:hypothetical protein